MTDQANKKRKEAIRWWVKLCVQPALFLSAGTLLLTGLGMAQKNSWISAGTSGGNHHVKAGTKASNQTAVNLVVCRSRPGSLLQ